MMREQLVQRLDTLRGEFAKGEQALAKLDSDAAQLRQTLLRISGAIQVLEELLAEERPQPGQLSEAAHLV